MGLPWFEWKFESMQFDISLSKWVEESFDEVLHKSEFEWRFKGKCQNWPGKIVEAYTHTDSSHLLDVITKR